MRNEQQHGALDTADRVPALLPCLIDPVLHQDDIRIVEHLSGGLKGMPGSKNLSTKVAPRHGRNPELRRLSPLPLRGHAQRPLNLGR